MGGLATEGLRRLIQMAVSSALSSKTLQCRAFLTFFFHQETAKGGTITSHRQGLQQKTTLHSQCFQSHGITYNYIKYLCYSTAWSILWERTVVTHGITSPTSNVLALMKFTERTYLIAITNLLCFHLHRVELTVMARSDHSYLTPLSNEKK